MEKSVLISTEVDTVKHSNRWHCLRRAVSQICSWGNNQAFWAVIKPIRNRYSFWLPTATNAPQNIPEIGNLYPKIPIKTALSRRQQRFETSTGCQPTTQAYIQKRALRHFGLGLSFCICCSFSCSHWQFLPVCGFEIDPKLGFNILMKTLADYSEVAKQLHPSKNGSIRPELLSYGNNKKEWRPYTGGGVGKQL